MGGVEAERVREERWIASLGFHDPGVVPPAADWARLLHQTFTYHGPVGWDDLEVIAGLATLDAGRPAVVRVAGDVRASTGEAIALSVVDDGGAFRIEMDGVWASGTGVHSVGVEEVTVEVADAVQGLLAERWWRVWPECSRHGRGLHPSQRDGSAVWLCSAGSHVIAVIGDLEA